MLAEAVAAPELAGAAIALAVLLALLALIALIQIADTFVRALFGTAESAVSWVPWLGSHVKRDIHKVEQRVINYLGTAEQALDKAVGRWIHEVVKLAEWTLEEIRKHANLLWILSTILLGSGLTDALKAAVALVRREIRHLTHKVAAQQQAISHTIPKTQTADRAGAAAAVAHVSAIAAHTATVDIPALRHRDKTLADGYEALRKLIKALGKPLEAATVGALAFALVRKLGAGWLSCRNWGRVGPNVCRMPFHLLEDFLALVTDFFVLTEVCYVVEMLERSLKVVQPGIDDLTSGIDKALCHGDYKAPAKLKPPALSKPAVQAYDFAESLPTVG